MEDILIMDVWLLAIDEIIWDIAQHKNKQQKRKEESKDWQQTTVEFTVYFVKCVGKWFKMTSLKFFF
jgi:hypothetical protein